MTRPERSRRWSRPLRAGHQPRVADLGFIALWALLALITTGAHLLLTLPAWAWQLPLLGCALQTLGVLAGLFLRTPTPTDYQDRKDL